MWRHHAACAHHHTNTFYPQVKGGRGNTVAAAYTPAIAICRRCPVTHECLHYALDHNDEHGVWGGTTPQDRQALQRIRKATA